MKAKNGLKRLNIGKGSRPSSAPVRKTQAQKNAGTEALIKKMDEMRKKKKG